MKSTDKPTEPCPTLDDIINAMRDIDKKVGEYIELIKSETSLTDQPQEPPYIISPKQ